MVDLTDLIIETSRKNLDNAEKRFRELDSKAIAIITVTGILISFLLGSNKFTNSLGITAKLLFLLTALSFLASIYYGVKTIRVRYIHFYPTDYFIENFKQSESTDDKIKIATVIEKYSETELELFNICREKGKDLEKSIYALGLSVSFLILYLLISTFGLSVVISISP